MTPARYLRRVLAAASLCALGCATLANEAGDSTAERPNALAGPFRLLRAEELGGFEAPYVLKKKLADFREATVLDVDESGALGQSVAYAMGLLSSKPGIYRFVASDGRSFDETPQPASPVLEASEAWEGVSLDAPEAVKLAGEILLFYSAEGGIGLARSSDGITFTKQPGPVLGPSGAPWEGGQAPRAPSFVEVAPGDYRLFYEANGRIGEARSSEGSSWQRLGADPVLEPAAAGDPADPPFDAAGVGDPEAWQAQSAEGRRITRVYYTGRSSDGQSAIGLAARFGAEGTLTRAEAPAFTNPRLPRAPAVVPYRGLTLLFVTQQASASEQWPAVAAAIAPGNVSIPLK